MHATSDGAFLGVEPFVDALRKADAVIEPGAPFHIHFSDIQFANRNETKHLPYGEGTLRAEPMRDALAQFEPPGDGDLRVADERVDGHDQGDPRSLSCCRARTASTFSPSVLIDRDVATAE